MGKKIVTTAMGLTQGSHKHDESAPSSNNWLEVVELHNMGYYTYGYWKMKIICNFIQIHL